MTRTITNETEPSGVRGVADLRTHWPVGTRLVGDEGYGPTTIRITYVSDQTILAVREKTPSGQGVGHESIWHLDCRDWREVRDA